MKITVAGPGAIGCFLAGRLADAGHDVYLLDSDPERAAAVDQAGVVIESGASSENIPVNSTASASSIGVSDILFVCVKSYDTAQAVRDAAPAIGPLTIAVSMQNGAGNIDILAEAAGRERTVAVVTGHGVTYLDSGHVRHAGKGSTSAACADSSSRRNAQQIAGILSEAGIETDVIDNADSLVWSKLVVNAAINPLTAVSDVENGALVENENMNEVMREVAEEAADVANALGIELLYEDPVAEAERVCRATAGNISSMLQDIRAGRRTEVDYITGVIIEKARQTGIDVPANEVLLEMVRKRES